MNSHSQTHLDLFSGIGGFAIAAQSAGFTTIGFSEIEPYACKILKRHWPCVWNYGDIKNVRGVSGVDLITGGFPCQPFSVAGKRGGSGDDRALWPEMLRVIAESRPRWVLGENVAGIISMELDNVLSDLENIGYSAWPIVIPACAVDARHRRDRVWIVAHSRGDSHRRVRKGGQNHHHRKETTPHSQEWSECEPWIGENGKAIPYSSRVISRTRQESGGSWAEASNFCRWETEPAVGRVANGIPNRTHRLRGLGNAIVPQVAEILIRAMLDATSPVRT